MRVAHVITRLIVGGAQENTIATVLGLRSYSGVEVELISGNTTGPEGTLEPLVAKEPGLLTLVPELVRPVHPWKDLAAFRRLVRRFQAVRPDIVHTHSGKAGIIGRLAAARAHVPVIIHTIHGPSFGEFQGRVSNLLFRSSEKIAARVTTHFVTVAWAMRDQYLNAGIGRPEQYTRVLSGFPLDPFLQARRDPALRRRLGLAEDAIVIGKIARLFRLKGHEDLFAAAPELVKRCPRLQFLLVGDGPWRDRFEALARARGLEKHFVFAGLAPPEAVPQYIAQMDLLAHLSRREGLARALPQALAVARPVVAYNCDGAKEICLEGETGFLIEPGNLSQFIEKAIILAQDQNLREKFGRRGRDLVRREFSVEKMVAGLYALYRRLLSC